MIATHSLKSLDSRLKQSPIIARTFSKVPSDLLSSDLLPVKFFASPTNAADIKYSRLLAMTANDEQKTITDVGVSLPEIMDGRIKQVLIPYHHDYCAITPVPNLAVIEAINESDSDSYVWHNLQPVKAGATNHGDPIASKVGNIKLLKNWLPKHLPDGHTVNSQTLLFLITTTVHNINVSSAYVSTGLPALTGIAGYVHVLERDTGLHLPFGFGIKNVSGVREAKLGTNSNFKTAKANLAKRAVITNEITATAEIAVVLKISSQSDAAKLVEAVKKVNRICGGSVFELQAGLTGELPAFFWYQKNSDPAKPTCFEDFINAHNQGVKLIQSGYAFLELPINKENARHALHAWAEPIFSLVEVGGIPDFFSLTQTAYGVNWE